MILCIEDIVSYIGDSNNKINTACMSSRDASFLLNVVSQLKNNIALTEGQANLLIKVLNENIGLLYTIPYLKESLDNPQYRYSFRKLDNTKKIFLYNNKEIAVKFPFSRELNNKLSALKLVSSFNKKEKLHLLAATQRNIWSLIDTFKKYDFEIDKGLLDLYSEIEWIKSHSQDYIPIMTDNLAIKNANKNLVDYYDANKRNELIPDLFLAKTLGIKFDHLLDSLINNPLTKIILQEKTDIDNRVVPLSKLVESLIEINSWPIFVIMENNSQSHQELENMFIDFTNAEISNKQMSVLFRSSTNKDLNEFIKNNQLNNYVDENTKIIFITQRIPKILLKINLQPKLILCLCKYFPHFSARKFVNSHPNVVYYANHITMDDDLAKL
jgi:hypothetical protein